MVFRASQLILVNNIFRYIELIFRYIELKGKKESDLHLRPVGCE